MLRALGFGAVTVATHVALMALLVGYEGGSRALSVGLETLARDHGPGVVLAALGAAITAGFAGATLHSRGQLVLGFAAVLGLDLLVALLVVAAVGELDLSATPNVFAAATGLGSQLAAALIGGVTGYGFVRRRRSHVGL